MASSFRLAPYTRALGFVATICPPVPSIYRLTIIVGQAFQVVGWGKGLYGKGKTTWKLENPMRRDTVTIPGSSHLIIRIPADNPGIWALHCHLLWHAHG